MKRICNGMIAAAVLLTLLPAAGLLALSLTDGSSISLRQYSGVFTDAAYWQYYGNSLKLTVFSLLPALPVGILSGLMLTIGSQRHQRKLIFLYFIALLMPFQVVTLPLFQLAMKTGLYDSHASIILLNTFAPLGVLVCWVLMRMIPREQWDAAMLDTSSVWVLVTRIVLPQVLPGLLALCILLWSESWNMVEQPLILLPTWEKQPLSLKYNDIVDSGGSYAGAVLYALPVVLLYIAAGRRSHRGGVERVQGR